MSVMICPHCGETVPLFGKGGGARVAKQMGIPLLGEIPADPQVVSLGDKGRIGELVEVSGNSVSEAYEGIIDQVVAGGPPEPGAAGSGDR